MGASFLTSRPRGVRAALVACLLLAALTTPHAACADVRPPIEAIIVGPPRAARDGRSFGGAFEFRAGAALTVDSLRLSGERWRVTRFSPRLPRALRPGERWTVSFRATPSNAHRPLVLQVKAGHQWLRKEFDLSSEAIARTRGSGSVSSQPPR